MADASHQSVTRQSLIVRLKEASDTDAWSTFVEVYGPLIYGRSRRKGLNHQDAEDVSQKVLARIIGAIRKFEYDPTKGRFRDWLGTVVNGEIYRFLRQQGERTERMENIADLDALETRSEDSGWTEEFNSQVLRAALARTRPHFEDSTWRAFELVWIENHSAADASAQLNQPIAWIYVAKSRVLKRLWQEVQELGDDAGFLWEATQGFDRSPD